jgi:ribosomal protein S20
MKPSTYASLVTLVFLVHQNEICKSIEGAIRVTDNFCKQFGLENDLSHMTKYRIIADLIQSKILVSVNTAKRRKLRLAKKISDMFP